MRKTITAVFFILLLAFSMIQSEAKTERNYRILYLKKPPAFVSDRTMTDNEISDLIGADLGTLKEKINTFGDFIAWTRIALINRLDFYNMESNDGNGFTFGAEYAYSQILNCHIVTPNLTVPIAQYVLEDNYPGIGSLFLLMESDSEVFMKCANYIPADGGYYIVNAELFCGMDINKLGACNLEHMLFVTELKGLVPYLEETYSSNPPVQILALESADPVALDSGTSYYIPRDRTHVKTIYISEDAIYRTPVPDSTTPGPESVTEPGQEKTEETEAVKETVSGNTEQSEKGYRRLNPNDLPILITDRSLTDDEISRLYGADLDTLKKTIRTYGDFSAWVRTGLFSRLQFNSRTITNDDWQYTFGGEFSFFWMQDLFSPNMTVSIAQYVLEDDYPGIGTVCLFRKRGTSSFLDMVCANCIPADGGYYLLNAEHFAGLGKQSVRDSSAFDEVLFVSDLTELLTYYHEVNPYYHVTQILWLDSADQVVLDAAEGYYIPQDETHVTTVFQDPNAKYPPEESRLNFNSYGFPEQLSTDSVIDAEKARTIETGTFKKAVTEINTLPDALNYLFYTGYHLYGSDIDTKKHDGEWHYNLKPEVVFKRGKGNCGCTAGLIAALLEGDYDEVGMIHMRFVSDGHVINYIKDGELYYVFDGNSWAGCNYEDYGLSFCYGSTLEEAALKYGRAHDAKNMVAYVNPRGGDCPIMEYGNAVKLPMNYCEFTILYETPEEGYVYILVDDDPAVMEAIDAFRSVW